MKKEILPTYGGQAVIEGVMMRGAKSVAIAMRSPENEIIIHTEELGGIYKSNISKIPFLRGLVLLWDALGLGMRALTLSANLQTDEDEDLEGVALYLTLGLSLAFGIGLFFLAPAAFGQLIEHNFGLNAWWGNLIEGVVRLFLLVFYIWSIGFMPDIKRVYAYHGAEHKTINAFEDGADLTPEVVAGYPLEHPRCGTAFLLNVVIISILLFTMMGPMSLFWRLISRVLFLPVITGIAYEYLRWTANHLSSPIVRWIIKPNLALQRLTTSEPDQAIIEVGIAAFNAMREQEKKLSGN
ncbi:MAG: DUF1385 domain-containing protein [Chloroflexi bacterium]|nr:DUF1385 domain-containing protein [Chloroflexota bacterium]